VIRYERTGAAALVTIDRQERRNAGDGETAAALLQAYERFAADDDAGVMVLTGAGEQAFCAGADLTALETLDPDAPGGPMGFTRLVPVKPAIAAIGGWCVAGGLELALWCDMRIAGERARFGCLERRWGVPLIDGGTQRLPRVVGLGRALDLIITGREVDAAEALAMGLVNEVVADPVARALELAEAIAAHPQETMLSDREAAHAAQGLPLADGLALEARLGRERITTALEGARRFRVRP
jgi:enoyl-CoA hydratase/carnithine racemase